MSSVSYPIWRSSFWCRKERDHLPYVSRSITMLKTDIPLTFNSIALSMISPNCYIRGLSGQTSNFEHRPRAKQCYNCQELADDIAHRYEKLLVCGRCAKKGHHHRTCTEMMMECVAGGGPQESIIRNCWKLYPTRNKLSRSELCSYMCGSVVRSMAA